MHPRYLVAAGLQLFPSIGTAGLHWTPGTTEVPLLLLLPGVAPGSAYRVVSPGAGVVHGPVVGERELAPGPGGQGSAHRHSTVSGEPLQRITVSIGVSGIVPSKYAI